MECSNCGKPITRDERGIYKRLVNRGAPDSECMCKQCLSARLEIPVDEIDKKIEHFKSIGCTLFN